MNILHPIVSPVHTKPIKLAAFVLMTSGLMTGCAATGEQYAWSHSMSGDYLFAYDQGQCIDQSAGKTTAPEFFTCMQGLGYFLIDPTTGVPIAALSAGAGVSAAEQASL